MQQRFRDLAIRGKLMLVIMLASSAGLVLAGVALVTYERVNYQQRVIGEMTTLTEIIGAQSTAALTFNDAKVAKENLAALRVRDSIIAAGIYDAKGKLFATYTKSGERMSPPTKAPSNGVSYQNGYLNFSQPIREGGETIGTVYIQKSQQDMRDHLLRYMLIVAGVIAVLMIGTPLLSGGLQRAIANPIVELAQVAHSVSELKDYSVRATKQGNDETGELIDTFNAMLGQIQESDLALRGANATLQGEITVRKSAEAQLKALNETLEQRVGQRTAALSRANEELTGEIAERQRAEAELQRAKDNAEAASHAKSEFLANMSHELRTPLNAVIGFSEILEDQTFGELNPRQAKYVGNILGSGRHLLQLINDILDLVKVEAGRMVLDKSTFDAAKAIDDVCAIVRTLANKKHIALEIVDSDLPPLCADQPKLKQILYNLLSNAIKFTPEHGSVTLRAHVDGPWMCIAVSDTGIGIRPEDQERIFGEFEQVDSSYARQQQGTGLGLTLTKRLIDLHGGRIEVKSEGADGGGSTFSCYLPWEESLHLEEDAANGDPTTTKSGRHLVLVVEDDKYASDLLSHHLEHAGYDVARAFNGVEALEKIRTLRPFAVTLDIILPELDGWQVLTEVKSDPEIASIPVIIVTMTEDRQLALGLGAVDFLTKPIDRNRLIEALAHIGGGKTGTILVVDDEPQTVQMLSDILENQGWRVLSAYGGREGIEMARANKPDAMILDLMMPEVTGFDVVAQLHLDLETANLPIVVFTAKDLSPQERDTLNSHIRSVVHKSGYTELLVELEKLSDRHSAPKEA